jgi:NADPH-dependent 2,4-dienoyl-CoA reductase/sulfur reductase-like enzyme
VEERRVSQVVAEHGTAANADLYLALKPLSRNQGAVDYQALIRRQPPLPNKIPQNGFDLVRIGDAVASRNIHAAIYDAARYCSLL